MKLFLKYMLFSTRLWFCCNTCLTWMEKICLKIRNEYFIKLMFDKTEISKNESENE